MSVKVLIHWQDLPVTEASWEDWSEIQARYPDFES